MILRFSMQVMNHIGELSNFLAHSQLHVRKCDLWSSPKNLKYLQVSRVSTCRSGISYVFCDIVKVSSPIRDYKYEMEPANKQTHDMP